MYPIQPILVVEDEESSRTMLVTLLRVLGYTNVISAERALVALSMAQDHLPSLIITDGMMPSHDGFELCYLLKKNELTQNIPIIMASGLPDGYEALALKAKADAYISKPYEVDDLRNLVASFIPAP